jgi:hypothetical protein
MAHNKTLRDQATGLAESLAPRVESARDKAGPALAEARDRASEVLDLAAPYVTDARNLAAPYVAAARDNAAPYVSDAREKVTVTFTTEVLPVVTAALAAVDDATEDARAETLKRGKAVAAALKGELAQQQEEAPATTSTSGDSHKLRNLLLALGVGGAGFAAVKRVTGAKKSNDWQTSYVPAPPASSGRSDTPLADAASDAQAHDVAASDPGEAVADATDTPHRPSSPDNPVTEVDLDKR